MICKILNHKLSLIASTLCVIENLFKGGQHDYENDIRMSRLDKTKEAATTANEELDWPNLNKYRKDNEKLAEAKNEGNRIVLIGDSITEGWSNLILIFQKK